MQDNKKKDLHTNTCTWKVPIQKILRNCSSVVLDTFHIVSADQIPKN